MTDTIPFRRVVAEIDARAGDIAESLELLSVSQQLGVIPRNSITDKEPRAEDLTNYKRCWPGDLVLNRMSAYQGALGLARQGGIVSPDYAVLRSGAAMEPRFLAYLMKSQWFVGEMTARLRGIGSPGTGSVRTPRVNVEDLGTIELPLPSVEEQRRIADFLDDQVDRIDAVRSAREAQVSDLNERFIIEVTKTVGGGTTPDEILPMSRKWLDGVPADWAVKTIGSEFDLKLGKMLNQERTRGDYLAPYLRNTNVQWDRIDAEDLEEMDFPPEERNRYEVLPGDLLICEGGQPGRAAVWEGSISPIYYQKALHRARPRRAAAPRWLLYCLLAAVEANYFSVENSTTTIAHLTGEQLSATRLPFPRPEVQRALVDQLDASREKLDHSLDSVAHSIALLEERKRALITAAVAGEVDVTTVRPIGMGKWVPNVGAEIERPVAVRTLSGVGGP